MDVNMISSVMGGVGGPVAASSASIPSDTQQSLASVASSTALSDTEKSTLVGALAVADSGVLAPTIRQELVQAVQGLGIYLRSTSNQSWPRWTIMTSLRSYGLNLTGASGVASESAENARAIAAQAQQAVAQVAQSKGVTVQQAVAYVVAAQAPEAAPPAAPRSEPSKSEGEVGHLVEKVV